MALLDTVSSVVRLPLHVAGKAVSVVGKVLPGGSTPPAPVPTDVAPEPVPATEPAPAAPVAKKTAAAKKAPVAKKAPATKAPAAKKAPATKAPAAKKSASAKKTAPAKKPAAPEAQESLLPPPVVDPIPEPVTEIDAAAATESVDVTPSDVADTAGLALDESAAEVVAEEDKPAGA